jgi:hypothetical protein
VSTLRRQSLEPLRVYGVQGDAQQITRSLGHQADVETRATAAQRLAQLADPYMQHRGCAAGRRLAPQHIDQPLGGNWLASVDQ